MEDILLLIWIVTSFIYGGKKGSDYFQKHQNPAVLLVLVLNFVLLPVLVTLKEFDLLPKSDWY